MPNRRCLRLASHADDDRPEGPPDPGLVSLFQCARALIRALETGQDQVVLGACVRAYVRSATAQGISTRRIREAVEFLMVEHRRAPGAPTAA